MIITENLALTVWDRPKDPFEHSKLAGNWIAIDQHDHSGGGKGIQLGTSSLKAESITAPLIKEGSIGPLQISPKSLTSAEIQDGGLEGVSLADNTISGAKVESGTLGFSNLDPHLFPLGSVIMWYRRPGGTETPGGHWEVCDGRPWHEITNTMGEGGTSLNTGSIPDMRGKFAMGASLNPEDHLAIASAGGSSSINLGHSHGVNAHSHAVESHTHGITNDGSHTHGFTAGNAALRSRPNAFAEGQNFEGHHNTLQSAYVAGFNAGGEDIEAPMNVSGSHSHSGSTQAASTGTSSVSGSTDTQLGATSTLPPYTGLLFIMRVR